jgi:PncC family amidohydrolase
MHIEDRIIARLGALEYTLATAESCSGGLVAHSLTNVSGASSCFIGGIVAYSNDVKMRLLGVDPDVLSRLGAVSEPVARQMADGVRHSLASDFGIGITGIAGPDGGSAEKPVGLVYIAVSGPAGTQVKEHRFSGNRDDIKSAAASAALSMLWEMIA